MNGSSIVPTLPVGGHDDRMFGGGGFALGLLFGFLFDRGRWGLGGGSGGAEFGLTPTLFYQGIQTITANQNTAALATLEGFNNVNTGIRNGTDAVLLSNAALSDKVSTSAAASIANQTSGTFTILEKLCSGFCGVEKGTMASTAALSNKIDCVDRNLSSSITNLGFASQAGFNAGIVNQDRIYTALAHQVSDLSKQSAAETCAVINNQEKNTASILDYLKAEKATAQAAEIARLQAEARDRANRDAFIEINNRQTAINTGSIVANIATSIADALPAALSKMSK